MKKFIKFIRNEECGQGLVEYALILSLIALVVIGGLAFLGQTTKVKLFEEVANKMS